MAGDEPATVGTWTYTAAQALGLVMGGKRG